MQARRHTEIFCGCAAKETTMSDELEKEALRLQRDLAMNVAEGTSVERDMALAQRNRLAAERSAIAAQRDAAQIHAAVEEGHAQSSTSALYVLLAVGVLALIIFAVVYFNRPAPQPSTTVVLPGQSAPVAASTPMVLPASPTPAPAPVQPPVVITRPAPAPIIVNSPPPVVVVTPSAPASAPAAADPGSSPPASADPAPAAGGNGAATTP